MAVNTTEIASVYDVLIGKVKQTLDAEYDSNKITSDSYATALVASMQQVAQIAVSAVQQQPTLDAQSAEILAATTRSDNESSKKVLLLQEQIESEAKNNAVDGLIDKQILDVISQTAVRDAQSAQDLLNKQSQKTMIDNQAATELKQALLVQEQIDSETKNNELNGLIDKQILDIVSQTSVRDAQSAQDLLNKQAQKLLTDAETTLSLQKKVGRLQ